MREVQEIASMGHDLRGGRAAFCAGVSALAILAAFAAAPVAAQSCTITSNLDAGAGTLRGCVEQANSGAADIITSAMAPDSSVALTTPVDITRSMAIGVGGASFTLSGGNLHLVDANALTVGAEVTLGDPATGSAAIVLSGKGGSLDFAGRIITTQEDATGIDYGVTSDDGAAIVHMRGAITTSGWDAYGAVADSDDNSFFLHGTIETTGQNATGINSEGLRHTYQLLAGSAITVSGKGADGIGLYGGDSRILVDGAITTKGEAVSISAGMGAYGIRIYNLDTDSNNEVRLQGHGSILTEADYAFGIYAEAGGNHIYLDPGSRIETLGASGVGISVSGDDNRIEILGASVITNGANSNAIVSNRGIPILIGADSEILTKGQASHGINARGNGGSITLAGGGSIETRGNFSNGLNAALNSVVLEEGSRIATTGQRSYGVYLETQMTGLRGSASIAGEVVTSGSYAAGVVAAAGRSDITIKSGGSVVTTGASAPGEVTPHALSLNGGSNVVTIESGALVSTAADNAHGIWAGGSGGDNRVYVGGSISATGAGADAIRFAAGSNNRVELRPGYAITGNVVGRGSDVLALGGEGSASFDLAAIGSQYTGFGSLQKSGAAVWTLTGDGSGLSLPVSVAGGTLDVAGALGGAVTVQNGATLGGAGTLGAVSIANGGILAPGNSPGVLNVDSLLLNNASVLDFELGTPGDPAASDRIDVAGDLTLDGLLNVTGAAGFGNGVYTLINYGTLIADNGLALGATPAGYSYALDSGAGTASAVTLEVAGGTGDPGDPGGPGGANQYWDGANSTPSGARYGRGGAGVWNATNSNWTNTDGSANAAGAGGFAVFYNGSGDVTVEGRQSATGLQFAGDGYRLVAGAGGALDLTDASSRILVDAGRTATLALPTAVAGNLDKQGAGTLALSDTVDVAGRLQAREGGTEVRDGGQFVVRNGAAIGVGTGGAASLTVSGAGSEMRVLAGGLQAGFAGGSGAILIRDGSHLHVESSYDIKTTPGSGPLGEDLVDITPIDALSLGRDGGTARLEVRDGGTLAAGILVVGEFAPADHGPAATADVILDGADSRITIAENLQMKMGGRFTLSGGAQLQTFADSALASDDNRAIIVPDQIGLSDTRSIMTVTGAGSRWTSGNVIHVDGVGTLSITDGAEVSVADKLRVGSGRALLDDGPSAILHVDDAQLQAGMLDIANGGAWAEVRFTNGATIETAGLFAGTGGTRRDGVSYAAQADILVSGSGTRWNDAEASSGFSLGRSGVTTLTITDGALVQTLNPVTFGIGSSNEARVDVVVSNGGQFATPAAILLGEYADATGTLLIEGTGSRVASGDTLSIGVAGRGEVTLGDHGLLIASHVYVGRDGGSGLLAIGASDADAWVSTRGIDIISGEVRLSEGGLLSLNGPGTIGAAGILSGVGLVDGGIVVEAGGAIAPGLSIGTLTVVDGVTFDAGSYLTVEVNPAGEADLLHVIRAAVIDGGTVQVLAGAGDYAPATTYTILTADGGRTGAFEGATSDLAFLTPSLDYDANNVYLTMTRNSVSFENVGITPNQIAAGNGTESLGLGHGAFDAVLDLSAEQARTAFDLLSGEIHASARTAMLEDSRFVRNAVWDRLRGAQAEDRGSAWGQGLGAWGHSGSDGNAARLKRSTGGLIMGADGAIGDTLRVGAVWGYTRTDFDVDARGSSGRLDSYHLGAYAGGQWGAAALRAGLAYSWHDVHTTRGIAFPAFTDSVRAGYDAGTFQAFGELGYGIALGRSTLEPFANIAHVHARSDAFRETGGNNASLSAEKVTTDVTFSTLGLRSATGFDLGSTAAVFRLGAGWRHAFGDALPQTMMRYRSGGDNFLIAGLPVTRDAATIDAGLDFAISSKASLGISYGGQFGDRLSDQTAKARFVFNF